VLSRAALRLCHMRGPADHRPSGAGQLHGATVRARHAERLFTVDARALRSAVMTLVLTAPDAHYGMGRCSYVVAIMVDP
jgi:hypothetical protein